MADLRKPKSSSLVLKEATEKENLESGGASASVLPRIAVKPPNGIPINDAEVHDRGFGDMFGGSEDLLKDETKDFVKPALDLVNTGDVFEISQNSDFSTTCKRGTCLIYPVIFLPKALTPIFCFVLSLSAAKNIKVSFC